MMSHSVLVILCTVPNQEVGQRIAKALITDQLAACVNLLPGIESVYRWDNQIETSSETLLLIKSQEHLYEKIEQKLISIHPYDCPEIMSLPVKSGFSGYLEWIQANVISAKQLSNG